MHHTDASDKGLAATKKLMHEWGKLRIDNGLLYRRTSQSHELVLPGLYKQMVLKQHVNDDMVHVGRETLALYQAKEASHTCTSTNWQYQPQVHH